MNLIYVVHVNHPNIVALTIRLDQNYPVAVGYIKVKILILSKAHVKTREKQFMSKR